MIWLHPLATYIYQVNNTQTKAMPVDPSRVQVLTPVLPAEYLEYNAALPLAAGEAIRVGTWRDAIEDHVLDDLTVHFGRPIEVVQVEEHAARTAIQRLYGNAGMDSDALETEGFRGESATDLRMLANEAPVIQFVNLMLLDALDRRASDVHIETGAEGVTLRLRIDGVLQPTTPPPQAIALAVVSRIKIMASLDIAERRRPQDGRIRLRLHDREVDVRVSAIPTLHGESVALRLLDATRGRMTLDQIGMPPDQLSSLRKVIARPQGMILVTGPTGSGKTTTLYAALEEIRTGRDKILTIEDPVEYQIPGVSQMPVNAKHGVSFSSALRAALRHDPDVIMVGEIRDAETAQIATQAALTGHLVLSTLHTLDSVGAIDRLSDLGVDRYLIASTLKAVVAQRLVRTACNCATSDPSMECPRCGGSGYYGRTGIHEYLSITPALRQAVQGGATADECRSLAVVEGMQSLAACGDDLVRRNVTTRAEVHRVTAGSG